MPIKSPVNKDSKENTYYLQINLHTLAIHGSMVWTVLFNRTFARSNACLLRFCNTEKIIKFYRVFTHNNRF